jgi:hypothetical protein
MLILSERSAHIQGQLSKKATTEKSRLVCLVDKMCKRKLWKQQEQAPHRLAEFTISIY